MEITPLGDSALIVRVRERFDDAPAETLGKVLGTFHRLQEAAIPGVIELAPAYTSVAVFFDPSQVVHEASDSGFVFESLKQKIHETLSHNKHRKRKQTPPGLIDIAVCYDPEFAFDLDHVARHAQISAEEVVELHSGAEYRVNCIGFTPGFPFLSGLPEKLATPRRSTPRKEIPAGSVGIGGKQTGVYPLKSPGGWNIIGRTPSRLFDPQKNPPVLLRAGDRVRFRAITREEFDSLKQ